MFVANKLTQHPKDRWERWPYWARIGGAYYSCLAGAPTRVRPSPEGKALNICVRRVRNHRTASQVEPTPGMPWSQTPGAWF